MADLNDEVNAISEHLRRLNMEFNRYGELTAQSADAIRRKTSAETYRDTQLEKSGQAAAESLQSLTKAVGSSATALYEGRQGATAFNDSIANMNTAIKQAAIALAVLAPGGVAVKVVASGLTALGLGIFTVVQEMQATSRTLLDTSYDSYKKLSAAGAATSTGLQGVAISAAKTGVSMLKMDEYLSLIGSNSDNLALFGKSVFDGRKKFDNLGFALEGDRQKLFALGMTQDDMNEGMMGFIRLQTLSGRARTMSDNELIAGTRKYLYEQDELTKLTGMSRKERQATREAALSEQRFGAKIAAMKASGDERQIAAAEELEKQNEMLAKKFPELAQGFRDLTTGMMTTEAAQKATITTQGQIITDIQSVSSGIKSGGEGAYSTLEALAKGGEKFNMSYQMGTGENFLIKFKETSEARTYLERSFNEDLKNIKLERDKTTGGAPGGDAMLAEYAKLLKDQQTAFTNLQQALAKGFKIGPIDFGMRAALVDVKTSVQDAVMESINKYFLAFGKKPTTPASAGDKKVPAAPADLLAAMENAELERTDASIKRTSADYEFDKAEEARLKAIAKDSLASDIEKRAAAERVVNAEQAKKEAKKAFEKAKKAFETAKEKVEAAARAQPVTPVPAPAPAPAPAPLPPAAETDEDRIAREKKAAEDRAKAAEAAKDTEAKKAKIAKAREALSTPVPELKLDKKTAYKDLVQEQKDAINHLLENMEIDGIGGRPIMDQTPGGDRGKEAYETLLKKSPAIQKQMFDAINQQIKNERKKKLEELEKQESDNTSKATPAGPNDSRKNQVADTAALADSQVAAATTKVVNIAEALPTRTDINDATAGLTINSDVATLNSKGMNVTLDNSSDVAKLIMEPVITQMETSQKDQSMARSNFEASIGDLKAEFSKQKATDELLLAAVQELIRIQKNGVSVNEKILAAQA